MELQDLPTELLHHIFSFACTDVGTTGRSLSMVSHHIHNASATFKLQSIALFGRKQTLSFAALVSHDKVVPHTKFLYIGGRETDSEMADIAAAARQPYYDASNAVREFRKQNPEDKTRLEQLQDIAASQERPTRSSPFSDAWPPALEVLYINVNERVAEELDVVRDVSLPRLVDLTTGVTFPLRERGRRDRVRPGPVLERCPSLRHLHLVEEDGNCNIAAFFEANGIAAFAPNLRTLRLSELRWDESVVLCAAVSIGVDIAGVHDTWFQPRAQEVMPLPKSVQKIVIKPQAPAPPDSGCCDSCDQIDIYHNIFEYSRRLVRETERAVFLKPDEKWPEPDAALYEWLEKAEGRRWTWEEKWVDTTPPKEA
ncbi:hypothetical protein HMN09_00685400 [Mycena chlorophos]|uniref:F-box domain-containing protein n=1 Tax=Mycena chlorophos TaxID=658473 RepID=A0A8H6SYL0_MYCCL|nr:hypothetical protein HMN09_00685400 [Mycena chlorophos]